MSCCIVPRQLCSVHNNFATFAVPHTAGRDLKVESTVAYVVLLVVVRRTRKLLSEVKMGGNAWERHLQARYFCNPAIPGLKSEFSRGNAHFQARKIVPWVRNLSNDLFLNLVKISAASIYRKYQNIDSIYHIVSYCRRKYRNIWYIDIKFLIHHLAEFSFIHLFIHFCLKKLQQQTNNEENPKTYLCTVT